MINNVFGIPLNSRYMSATATVTGPDGNTVSDFDAEEIKRQISIQLSLAPIEFKGNIINLIDTPGYFDFEGEVMSALRAADAGTRYGIPTLGVVAVGKQMERTEKFFQLATRVLAENGANIVKSYYCDGFERVAAACPVPIVIAGGKKLPELEALQMAYQAIAEGAHGVDMGRNIFQSDCPAGMAQAIGKVVHEGYTAQQAYEVYEEVKNSK